MNWDTFLNLLRSTGLVTLGLGVGGVVTWIWCHLRQKKQDKTRNVPQHLMDGFLYYLDGQYDQSVDAFRTVVEKESNIPEVYFILGRIFRNHGDTERAVRVHQSITLRPNIHQDYKRKALFELAGDFRSTGNLTRSRETLLELTRQFPTWPPAYLELCDLAETEGKWDDAASFRERYNKLTKDKGEGLKRVSRYLCQSGLELLELGEVGEAQKRLRKAYQADGRSVMVKYAFAKLYAARGKPKDVFRALETALEQSSRPAPLLLDEYRDLARVFDKTERFDDFLEEKLALRAAPVHAYLLQKIIRQHENGDSEAAREGLLSLAQVHGVTPQVMGLARQLEIDPDEIPQAAGKSTWECCSCHARNQSLSWYCPSCHAWDSLFPPTEGG